MLYSFIPFLSIFLFSGAHFCSLFISSHTPAPIALNVLVNPTGSLEMQMCCSGYFGSFIFYCRSEQLPPRTILGEDDVLPWVDISGRCCWEVQLCSPGSSSEVPAQTAHPGLPDSFMVDQLAGWPHPVVGAVLGRTVAEDSRSLQPGCESRTTLQRQLRVVSAQLYITLSPYLGLYVHV